MEIKFSIFLVFFFFLVVFLNCSLSLRLQFVQSLLNFLYETERYWLTSRQNRTVSATGKRAKEQETKESRFYEEQRLITSSITLFEAAAKVAAVTYINKYMYICISIYTFIYTLSVYIFIYVYICTFIYVCICVYVYTVCGMVLVFDYTALIGRPIIQW